MQYFEVMKGGVLIKENMYRGAALSTWWLCAGLAGLASALALVMLVDSSLPEPLTRATAPRDRFIAEIAHEHLVNLTSIGPRVAGSYENEVLAVRILVEALRQIARDASPHNRVEVDVHKASGAFSLSFFDGMTNMYRDVQSVVARVGARGAGAGARGAAAGARGAGARGAGDLLPPDKTAVLINCHYDTVPDSPGASDDGAGCAVALEVFRALSAAAAPLRHSVVLLLNGAEENIMQASHAFITTHPWARSVRVFVNLEACGAGGREVLFQAGPHDPWIMEVYASHVPHPFASSVAQEMFQSGLIPGDTDYRIFRDFGNLSGVDLAWSSNGYVYHTPRDTHAAVPPAVLQRTGDNVLALLHGMLWREELARPVERTSRQGLFFDVVGLYTVSCRPRTASLLAATLLVLFVIAAEVNRPQNIYMSRVSWWWLLGRTSVLVVWANVCGVLASAGVAWLLCAAGMPLLYHRRVWLLVPLYAAPAVGVTWCACWRYVRGAGAGPGVGAGRVCGVCVCGVWCVSVCACAARGVNSGLLPALHALPVLALLRPRTGWWAWWCGLGVMGCVQTCYLAHGALGMLVPVAARSGTPPVHIDVVLGALTGALALCASCSLLPLVLLVRRPAILMYACLVVLLVGVLAACMDPFPFSPLTPRRVMLFHVRRSIHGAGQGEGEGAATEYKYWMPHITPVDLAPLAEEVAMLRGFTETTREECRDMLYCGAPYFLPVLGLISRGAWVPSTQPPLVALQPQLSINRVNDTTQELVINYKGPPHVVVIVSPAAGAHVSRVRGVRGVGGVAQAHEAHAWARRRVYFLTLHDAHSQPRDNTLHLLIQHKFSSPPEYWVDVSVSGHAMSGPHKCAPEHERFNAQFPDSVALSGWGVDMHLYRL